MRLTEKTRRLESDIWYITLLKYKKRIHIAFLCLKIVHAIRVHAMRVQRWRSKTDVNRDDDGDDAIKSIFNATSFNNTRRDIVSRLNAPLFASSYIADVRQ